MVALIKLHTRSPFIMFVLNVRRQLSLMKHRMNRNQNQSFFLYQLCFNLQKQIIFFFTKLIYFSFQKFIQYIKKFYKKNASQFEQIIEKQYSKYSKFSEKQMIKKKLSKLLRFKTQEFSRQKTNDGKDTCTSKFSIKLQKNYFNYFKNQHNRQQKINRTIQPLFTKRQALKINKGIKIKQKQNLTLNNLNQLSTSDFSLKKNKQDQKHKSIIQKIINQINKNTLLGNQINIEKQFRFLILIGTKIIEDVYFYSKVETYLKTLNQRVKLIQSKSLIFQVYTLSAQVLFSYGNYSLSIYYFDKALKKQKQIQVMDKYSRQKEIQIYKTVAKIFLIKNQIKIAKQFAYKYLRKTWLCENFDQQLNAYDILGKIYKQIEQKDMSIYFHNKMCKGQRQSKQIIKLSNYELQKCWKQIKQLAVYQTIQLFVQKDKVFHQMLEDRYRMKKRTFEGEEFQIKNIIYLHTNRSPNRNLNTYRILQRKLIQEKKSKQLHFLKPKQTANLKKIVSQFLNLIKGLLIMTNQNQFQLSY